MHLLLLLLLLLQPLQLQGGARQFASYGNISEEFLEYLEEVRGTGPTRPPTKKKIVQMFMAEPGRPLTDRGYCSDEMKFKNVHYRFQCVTEHYFIDVSYEEMKMMCSNPVVPCKNGIERCRKSNQIIHGVYCNFMQGDRMPDCQYESFYRKGYALITCRWKNETQEFIPDGVNDIVAPD
ncbi:PREDICTED: inactive ribonuclease-like protein 9 [Propithecus coquereli]|uniref:inactive ribonuclease-like protein 9 n=1 Tax=Propithecus coquereli TaxID=379532 RepID=UPI00063FB6ED|nr:PREDICTED: inactive ribonuclease-like protein 9 [Propithecus coquereli]